MKKRGFEVVSGFAGQGIELPQRATARSAGYDLAAAADVTIAPGEAAVVPTGLKAYMGAGEFLAVFVRSSLAKKRNLALANGVGVVDADYYGNAANEGHIGVLVRNHGDAPAAIKKGERVAQGIFLPYLLADGDAADGVRRGGFGSTDKSGDN